jgi:hypothetical protein
MVAVCRDAANRHYVTRMTVSHQGDVGSLRSNVTQLFEGLRVVLPENSGDLAGSFLCHPVRYITHRATPHAVEGRR